MCCLYVLSTSSHLHKKAVLPVKPNIRVFNQKEGTFRTANIIMILKVLRFTSSPRIVSDWMYKTICKESTYSSFVVFNNIYFFLFDKHDFHWKWEQNLHSTNSSMFFKICPRNGENKWWLWSENVVRLTENSAAEIFNNKI